MPGWSHHKRETVEAAFYKFLSRCYINSKDKGRICLGEELYQGQIDVITQIFDALEQDVHDIYILKSRQLGISTLVRALIIFLLGLFPGLKGAVVFDTDNNKAESRAEIEVMINDLPSTLKFPDVKGNNRTGLTLKNDSKVLFMSGGVRKSKTSGTLGRSVGLSLATISELCSIDNDEGLEAFEQSLSDSNPDRLYIRESTARGFNRWWEMWGEARKNPNAHCIFLGWWAKNSQRIERDHPDFERYGIFPPSDKEIDRIKRVRELYNVEVSPEMLAWYRKRMDPTATAEGDAPPDFDGNPTRIQEQPWTEEEAFQQTGAVFFAPEKLTVQCNDHVSVKFKSYMYVANDEFVNTEVMKAPNSKMVELKVWEEPTTNDGVYVMGVDPAYGENENNDRSSIQILRCFADGMDQVAEYAWPMIGTQQLAWVISSLLGWYGSGNNEIRYILELNGPGMAVWNALKGLKYQIENGRQSQEIRDKGLTDVFRNVKNYLYTRADSLGGGFNYHFKTTTQLKIPLMERLRDFTSNGMLRLRSMAVVDEMKTIAREGDSIKAPGSMKDDRVLAMALAVHCWEEKVRRNLMAQKRTRASEAARQRMSVSDQVFLFNQNLLENMFKQSTMKRVREKQMMTRAAWRGR